MAIVIRPNPTGREKLGVIIRGLEDLLLLHTRRTDCSVQHISVVSLGGFPARGRPLQTFRDILRMAMRADFKH